MRLVGGLLALVATGLFASCFEGSPEQRERAVCNTYCECLFASPAEVAECVTDECLPVIPPVTDDCLDCVVSNANSCTALDAQCTDLCFP